MKIWLEKIHLDLKVNWKLSRNQTTFKENFIVHLQSKECESRSEIAPNIRYGETIENILDEFQSWLSQTDLENLKSVSDVEECLKKISLHSLRFGLESVLLSWLASREQKSLTSLLGLSPVKPIATSFTMPIIPVGEIAEYLKPLKRFHSLKIKVDAESSIEMLREVHKHTSQKLRVDANEGWRSFDEFMKFEESLKGLNIELIEQPFPSTMVSEYKELKQKSGYKILADESIEDMGDFEELSQQFHAINVKLMKTGSLIRARDLISEARKYNLETMMGCMIETTIGISYGMLFSGMVDYVDLDGSLLIKDEPFHLVSEAEGILSVN